MPYNLPQFDTRKFSIGPSVVYIGAAGQTPTIDLGAVTAVEIKATYEMNKFFQNIPATATAYRFKSVETAVTFKGLEWDLSKIRRVMGGYYVETLIGGHTIQELYGNFEYADPVSLKVVHETPNGIVITIDVYNAYPGGNDGFHFTHALHEHSYTFHAAASATDFAGNALPPNTPFKIKVDMPFTES